MCKQQVRSVPYKAEISPSKPAPIFATPGRQAFTRPYGLRISAVVTAGATGGWS